jgi:protein-tyrosine kinase
MTNPTVYTNTNTAASNRSIGAILINAGRLTQEAAERIVHKQQDNNALFGEAGIQLGLITRDDVEFAIASQYNYSVILGGQSRIAKNIVAAYEPHGTQAESLRALRTQLLMRWLENQPTTKTLAVVSADRGEGRSHLAANLAVVFSQLGHSTLLIDADFRNPQQHLHFDLTNRQGLSTLLQGKGDSSLINSIDELRNLSVLPSGPTPPNPQELLSHARFSVVLAQLAQRFDIVILDTPAATQYADANAVSMRAGAALAVARQGHTSMAGFKQIREDLQRLGANVLGSVLLSF